VKSKAIRQIAVESVTGTFAVGNTISKGSGGNTSVATIFAVASGSGGSTLYIGPSTLTLSRNSTNSTRRQNISFQRSRFINV